VHRSRSPHAQPLRALLPALAVALLTPCVAPPRAPAEPKAPAKGQEVDYNVKDNDLSQQVIDQAEELFFKAFVLFQKKEYERAAELFQRAYALIPYHDLLFNVARSRELMGDKAGAVEWYRAYLSTKPVDETTVIHRLKLLGGEPTSEPLVQKQVVEPTVEVAPVSYLPWITLTAGVAVGAFGAFYGLSALDTAERSRKATLPATHGRLKEQAESEALIADISLGVSAIVIGLSVYLWVSADHEEGMILDPADPAASGLSFGLSQERGEVFYRWRF
jgi:tetratricopeptide (TPR) repeat protein